MSEVFSIFADTLKDLASTSGFANLQWQNCVMILVSFIFMYLAIAKKFEPLLLLPISFGMLLTNLPLTAMYTPELFEPLYLQTLHYQMHKQQVLQLLLNSS